MISNICEVFGCTPGEAAAQDMSLVQGVIDYRNARLAVDVFNGPDKAEAFKTLQENPHLVQALAYMRRAQNGSPLAAAPEELMQEGLEVAELYRAEEEED